MTGNGKDARIDRLWYLPEWYDHGYKSFKDWESICIQRNITENWDKVSDWNSIKKVPYIFFSRAPLTFGHSQLVIPTPPNKNTTIGEADFFKWAACLIEGAIATFNVAFVNCAIHEKSTYKSLAEVTQTQGNYIKTLILRASASERIGEEYKVHLVPYFESQANDCSEQFHARHKLSSTSIQKGGLLGWLGERENRVDEWEVDSLWKYKLDGIANHDLKMAELAKVFRSLWK